MLLDLRPAYPDVTGKQAEQWLEQAAIVTNKNLIPFDQRKPGQTSGLRLGTPAVTTRGFNEDECRTLTHWMCDILDDIENDNMIATVQHRAIELCERFPVYGAASAS